MWCIHCFLNGVNWINREKVMANHFVSHIGPDPKVIGFKSGYGQRTFIASFAVLECAMDAP